MKRTEKFADLRKNLKQELRNPGEIELDTDIERMTSHTTSKTIGNINTTVLIGAGCVGVTAFVAGYATGKIRRK